ncbi:hypothetical protein McanMca71_005001 [Microsporum canis]
MFFSRLFALAVATNVALISAGPTPSSDTCNINASIWSLTGFNGRRKELPIDSECNPLADPFVTSVGSAKLPHGALCQFYSYDFPISPALDNFVAFQFITMAQGRKL